MERTRGWLITFEGIDGSGKTTQLRLLAQFLQERGLPVLVTQEPGGTEVGRRIRELLLDPALPPIAPLTELLLMEAARAQHVAERLRPALEAGTIVLCDRYTDATLAYQGGGRGLDRRLLDSLNAVATGGLQPDLTLLLDLDPQEAQKRIAQEGRPLTRIEQERIAFHRQVRETYRRLAQEFPDRIVLLDASGPIEVVQERIRSTLSQRGILPPAQRVSDWKRKKQHAASKT